MWHAYFMGGVLIVVYSAEVEVVAPIYDTEVRERVEESVLNVFPDAELRVEDSDSAIPRSRYRRVLRGETHSVERLKELVRRQEIMDTIRSELLGSLVGDTVNFRLKKQAAYEGRVNLDVGGHELGSLKVRIESDDPHGLIDYIAPATEGEDE